MAFFLIYDWIDIHRYDKLTIGNLRVTVKIILLLKELSQAWYILEEKNPITSKINNGETNKKTA